VSDDPVIKPVMGKPTDTTHDFLSNADILLVRDRLLVPNEELVQTMAIEICWWRGLKQ
jgi:hypothetical protein